MGNSQTVTQSVMTSAVGVCFHTHIVCQCDKHGEDRWFLCCSGRLQGISWVFWIRGTVGNES